MVMQHASEILLSLERESQSYSLENWYPNSKINVWIFRPLGRISSMAMQHEVKISPYSTGRGLARTTSGDAAR
eukprot:11969944-Heterocapsa_arctica.AAC.1